MRSVVPEPLGCAGAGILSVAVAVAVAVSEGVAEGEGVLLAAARFDRVRRDSRILAIDRPPPSIPLA